MHLENFLVRVNNHAQVAKIINLLLPVTDAVRGDCVIGGAVLGMNILAGHQHELKSLVLFFIVW